MRIDQRPVVSAGPDKILYLQFSTVMNAELDMEESGNWSLDSGSCEFNDRTDPKTAVSNLAKGNNFLVWTITRGVCPPVTDTVTISVSDFKIPTLITPNGDPMNEYFEILGIEAVGKTELIVFDRKGELVFKNRNYDNKWNGVDYSNNPLPNDAYFFILQFSNGLSNKGYIVIRR